MPEKCVASSSASRLCGVVDLGAEGEEAPAEGQTKAEFHSF